MKKNVCVFTIVRNEKIFLPIWFKYYSQFFNIDDIYIIDDTSTDNSVDFYKTEQIITTYNEFAYDHNYLRDTVNLNRIKLLGRYNYVIFTEVDEILIHLNLKLNEYIDVLNENNIPYSTTLGYEIYHKMDIEPNYDPNLKILDQRNFWFKHELYDKCLISNQIFNYEGGFHFIQGINKYDYLDSNLYMIHLHRFDYFLHMERKMNFIKNNKYIDDPSWDTKIN